MKINVTRRGDALWPVDEADQEVIRSHKDGKEFVIDLKGARNPRFHRLAMGVFRKVTDAGAADCTAEQLRDHVLIKLGYCDAVTAFGHTWIKPRSISFASMDEAEFKRFMDRAVYVLFTDLLPGAEWHELRDEVSAIYDAPMWRAA